jgi:superfamily II DNA/RNA helicase
VAILLKSLQKHGFNAGALHGDMDQSSRTATLDSFREGRISLLAASDVAARGLDIPDVSHIFNFDVPWQADDYVHRIGRTGRAGKEGRSLTLVTPEDIKQLKDIEKMLGVDVTWIGEAPSAEDIADGSKRRRGRGGRGARPSPGGRPEARGAGGPGRNGRSRSNGARPEREPGATRQLAGQAERKAPEPTRIADEQPRQDRAAARPRRVERTEQPFVEHDRSPVARQRREPAERASARTEPAARPERQNGKAPRQAKAPPRQPWEPREPRRQPDHSGGPTPVGLGDHVPAFLRKTTRTAG